MREAQYYLKVVKQQKLPEKVDLSNITIGDYVLLRKKIAREVKGFMFKDVWLSMDEAKKIILYFDLKQ